MTFPTYPQLLSAGYGERPRPNVARTPMESGPPKQAKIASRQLIERPVLYRMTKAEKGTFYTWFSDTINYGADWFDWNDPVDGATKSARIVGGEIAWTPETNVAGYWRCAFTLETWE